MVRNYDEVIIETVNKKNFEEQINFVIKENNIERENLDRDIFVLYILIFIKIRDKGNRDKIYHYLRTQLDPYRASIRKEREILLLFKHNISSIENFDEAMLLLNHLDLLMEQRYREYDHILAEYRNFLDDGIRVSYRYKPIEDESTLIGDKEVDQFKRKILELGRKNIVI